MYEKLNKFRIKERLERAFLFASGIPATVVEGIREVASSSKELSIVSANQAATMQEAEAGVNQISDVIQTNAAVAEESSATSLELSAQAAALDGLIAKFNLP